MLARTSSYYHHHYHLNRCRLFILKGIIFIINQSICWLGSQISCSRRQPNKPQLTKTNLFQFNLCIFTFDCIARMSDLLRINQAAPCRLPRSCYVFGGNSHSFYFGHPFILIILHIMTEGRLTRRLISFLVGRSMLMLNVGGHYNASNCDF